MKIRTNPDKEEVKKIREEIAKNDGYCTCQVERNENTKCLCSNFLKSSKIGCAFVDFIIKKKFDFFFIICYTIFIRDKRKKL